MTGLLSCARASPNVVQNERDGGGVADHVVGPVDDRGTPDDRAGRADHNGSPEHSMSGEVNGFGVIALHAAPGGFQGTLSVSGSLPAGTEVVVGTCGGKVGATASVIAA